MDALTGVFPEGVWSSLGETCDYDDANFIAQLLGMCTFSAEITDSALGADLSSYLPSNGSTFDLPGMSGSLIASKGISDPYLSGLYNNGPSVLLSGSSSPGFASDSSSVPMDYSLLQELSNGNMVMDSTGSMDREISQLDFPSSVANGVEYSPIGDRIFSVGVRKRSRSTEHVHEEKLGRSKVARRLEFTSQIQEEANVTCVNALSSSPCTSREDVSEATCSSLNLKENTGTENILTQSPKGKARASRGSATDPQSLYARKRREKINERLRILQNLVPNGTKVDISTMLEEAVHYVKFLRLQIQLLSSDELWMYAPIAYNGTVDIAHIHKLAKGKLL